MATIQCQQMLQGEQCKYKSKELDGQRRFCKKHHQLNKRHNSVYTERINAFHSDPELVVARAAVVACEAELDRHPDTAGVLIPVGAPRRLAFEALMDARAVAREAYFAARERQQPGIIEAETIAEQNARRFGRARARARARVV